MLLVTGPVPVWHSIHIPSRHVVGFQRADVPMPGFTVAHSPNSQIIANSIHHTIDMNCEANTQLDC